MKIVLPKMTTFGELEVGSIFMIDGHPTDVMMKVNGHEHGRHVYNAIDLENGDDREYEEDHIVIPKPNAELVVN